jgi:hypothetical protein
VVTGPAGPWRSGLFAALDPADHLVVQEASAELAGVALAEAFGRTLNGFLAEHVTPLADDLAAVGESPRELLASVAGLLRAAADGIEGELDRGQG